MMREAAGPLAAPLIRQTEGELSAGTKVERGVRATDGVKQATMVSSEHNEFSKKE